MVAISLIEAVWCVRSCDVEAADSISAFASTLSFIRKVKEAIAQKKLNFNNYE